jgi:outer membrane receptor protein involved in Fe transport
MNKVPAIGPKMARNAIYAALIVATTPLTAHAVLEEVIVTAQKRAQSANDVGMSISAFSGEELGEKRLYSLEEISMVVPGLEVVTSQQNTPIITLRGVGFNESSLGVYPAVSMYVDEVPLVYPALAAHSSYDLERIEVLKGPQGVLFGQNSTGGAINFIAAKPTDEFAAGGDVSFGRFNSTEINAFVSGPLSDNVGARLSVQHYQADEWQISNTRPGDENGEQDYTAARLIMEFEPSDTSKISVNFNGWTDKSDPMAFQFVAASPKRFDLAPDKAAEVVAVPFTKEDARYADWSPDFEPKADREFFQGSVRGDFELSETKTLTALVAYSDYSQDNVHDGDGMDAIAADFEHNKGEVDSTFAEIRLAHSEDNVSWVVGVNYEDSSTFEDQLLRYVNNTSHRASAVFINGSGSLTEQDIESYAVFGNVDYNLSEKLVLKLGARYTETTIDAELCGYAPANLPNVPNTSGDTNSNVAFLFTILGSRSTRPFEPLSQGDCFTLDGLAGAGGTKTEAAGIPGKPFIDTLKEDNASWRVGLDYEVSDDVLVYGNVSQGYKAGSYPTLSAATINELFPVTQESVLAYEAGFKAALAANTVQLNGAVFYYDYEDKQVRGKFPDPIFGPLDRLINVPSSTIFGAEFDVVAQLSDNFTLTAAVTYLDSEVDEYIGFSVLGVNPSDPANNAAPEDLSGNSLPFTPELSYRLGLDYTLPMNGGGEFFAGLSASGQSESDAVFNGDDIQLPADRIAAGTAKSIETNYFSIDSYWVADARVGYRFPGEKWTVMAWGKNITDEYYYTSVLAASENGARVSGRPRTYGLSIAYEY